MKFRIIPAFILLFIYSIRATGTEQTVNFEPFGGVALYSPAKTPTAVVLLISGDGGWNLGVVDMARQLAATGALVAGIDMHRYYRILNSSKGACSYPASDFEALSKYIQKKLMLPSYLPPVLLGYSSGATLAYATLVQAPPNTFAGAISMGFCSDLSLSKPLCKGNGLAWETLPNSKGFNFLPAQNLAAPWVAFQGMTDRVCDPSTTQEYVKKVPGGEIVMLPKVGHGFSVQRNWMPQFREALLKMVRDFKSRQSPGTGTESTSGLPLVEVKPQQNVIQSNTLAVIISGDGGWAGLDRQLGTSLAAAGIPVVGFNSLQYFWTARTPDSAARDLQRILDHYLFAWKKEHFILIGYSFGADVLPFLTNRLPQNLRNKIRLIGLLGPSTTAQFEFHLTDWIVGNSKDAQPVLPEISKLQDIKTLCVYGKEEEQTICKTTGLPGLVPIQLSGGHHFGGDYQLIATKILEQSK